MAKIGAYDFTSKDPRVMSEIDALIWRMRTDNRMRPEQIDIRLGCAPKRVQEALARPNPNAVEENASVLESWQLPEAEKKKPPVEHKHTPAAEDTGTTLSAAIAKREPVVRRPPPERTSRQTRTVEALPKAPARLAAAVMEARKSSPKPPLPAAPDAARAAACQNRINAVILTAYNVFKTDDEELRSTDRNLRADACRNAIYLVLDFEGIGPEVVAPYFGRTIEQAVTAHASGKRKVLDKSQATNYFTEELCKSMRVDFLRLQAKCI